jgi:hypothetical protein
MSTKYGLPLSATSKQNILPAITEDGLIKGWYPIAETTFTGAETTFVLSDSTVPVSSVTVDVAPEVTATEKVVPPRTLSYMAAVFPKGLAANLSPWSSADLIPPDANVGSRWSLTTQNGALLVEGTSLLVQGLKGLDLNRPGAALPAAIQVPDVTTPLALTWNSSMAYSLINGACSFFEFNWVTLFQASSQDITPLSISVVSVPPNIHGSAPFAAVRVGPSVATPNGPVYSTMRVVRLHEPGLIPTGVYVFVFRVMGAGGLTADVTLNLTIA